MATQVTCVDKKNNSNSGITHIGAGATRWTKAEAIAGIKNNTLAFYTKVGGKQADVVVRGTAPDEYLTTDPDVTTTNNLLSLGSCQ